MNQALAIREDMPLSELGSVLAKSGYFTDARDASQAIVKVLAGREMGFGPIASMTGIYIVKGKPSMGANLIAAAIKRSGRYDYRVKEMTDTLCRIEFYERENGKKELIGVSEFDATQAKRAGTQNMDKFPRNMLFARAMSNGAKWFCADVFGGPVYTPDELGANVNEEGEIIDQPAQVTVTRHEPQQAAEVDTIPHFEPLPVDVLQAPKPATNGNGNGKTRPYAPEVVKIGIDKLTAKHADKPANDKQRGLVSGMLEACFAGDMDSTDKSHSLTAYLIGVETMKDATPAQVNALLDWVKPTKDDGGAYQPDSMAVKEAQAIVKQRMINIGQAEMDLNA